MIMVSGTSNRPQDDVVSDSGSRVMILVADVRILVAGKGGRNFVGQQCLQEAVCLLMWAHCYMHHPKP